LKGRGFQPRRKSLRKNAGFSRCANCEHRFISIETVKRGYKMRKRILFVVGSVLLLMAGYLAGSHNAILAYAGQGPTGQAPSGQSSAVQETAQDYSRPMTQGEVPKSYGKLATAFADSIGTGLVFEDKDGVIRFVSVSGMKEGELARYDQTPVHGGVPRSYGHLVSAVVNHGSTGLVFEDAKGVIRFVTLTGVTEGELTRE
jgi:hypothetical protein